MKLSISNKIMRWLDPNGEEQRMHMRYMRCMAEANADDLVRTIITHGDKIKEAMKQHSKTNGKKIGIVK